MKFFSVVLLAALCATAVSAAPQSTPNFSFDEYGLSRIPIFDGIVDKLKDYFGNLQCIRDVVSKAVQESEFKSAWDETKTKIDTLFTVDWNKCLETEGTIEKNICKGTVVEEGFKAFTIFLNKLVGEAKWELVKEIKGKIVNECFEEHATFFDLEEEEEVEEFQATLPEQFECLVEVLGDVSKANGLEDLWSKTEPQVLDRLNKWKQCPNAGNKFLVILCNVKEGVATYRLVTEYIRLVAAENPQVIQEFIRQIQAKCSGQTYAELMRKFAIADETNGNKGVETIKCITESITDAVKETDFNKIWDEYKNDLDKLQERIKSCKNESSQWDAAKCVAKEIQNSHIILQKFLANLKNANYETYDRVKKYIKQRCFA